MDDDLGKFHTNAWKHHKLDPMDIDFPAKTLLQLFQDEVLEIVLTGQFSRKCEEGSSEHKKNTDAQEGNPKTRHTTPFGLRTGFRRHLTESPT
jgi:hypothetical protein